MKKRLGKFLSYWLPPFLWMALIFWASSFHTLRASPVGWQDFMIRKTAHFLEYAILFGLNLRALKNTTKLSLSRAYILSFVLALLYAISDEFHQIFVDGRTGMARDIFIDAAGIVGGWLAARKFDKKRESKL